MALPASRAQGRSEGGGRSSAPLRLAVGWSRILASAFAVLLPHAAFGDAQAELVEVRSATHPGFTRVVLETDFAVPFSVENRSRGEPPAVEVQLPAAATAPRIGTARAPVTGIRIEQTGDAETHAKFAVESAVDVWTNRLEGPPRIVLDLHAATPLAEVARRDPEDLTDRPYQIVVEPEAPGGVAATPSTKPELERAGDRAAVPRPAPPETPRTESEPAAPFPPPPVAADTSRREGLSWDWVLWRFAPWSWIVLAWVGVALVFLVVARVWRAREPELERLFPEPPRSGVPPPPLSHPAGAALEGEHPALRADPEPEETAQPARAVVPPTPAPEAPTPARFETETEREEETPSAALPDFLKVLQSLDRRIARLEAEVAGSRELRDSLAAQSAAQAEELRIQRAAVARITRRPKRPRPSAPPPSSS